MRERERAEARKKESIETIANTRKQNKNKPNPFINFSFLFENLQKGSLKKAASLIERGGDDPLA